MNVLDRLKALLLNQYNIDAGSVQTGAPIQSLGLDSLDMVDFFYSIEQEFKIKLPTENLQLKTVQDLLDLVERTVEAQKPTAPPNRAPE